MILASALSLVLTMFGNFSYAPAEVLFTLRFNQPVYGQVCVEAVGDDQSGFAFKSSCEDLNGSVKQIRWRPMNPGTYQIRATFKGGTQRIVTNYQTLTILTPAGWPER